MESATADVVALAAVQGSRPKLTIAASRSALMIALLSKRSTSFPTAKLPRVAATSQASVDAGWPWRGTLPPA
jgi:hypothetical protein